jgi:predicted ATPase/DNA-binding XRE family transcriptional regulator
VDLDASFGNWLMLRRKALHLSRVDLARRVGCAIVTLRKIEADERRPSQQIAEKLADHLNLADQERTAFIKAARGERGVNQLSSPTQLADRGSIATRAPLRTKAPIPLTPLIGRAQEIAAIRDELTRTEVRLLTLTGAPGIGKTRLALQVATELQDAFTDGVIFTALAPIRNPALVVTTIVHALEITELPGQPVLEGLQAYLRDRHILLLLDNFEQVLQAAPQLAALLAMAPRLKVFVTSRVALHLSAEHRFTVPPLALPDVNRLPTATDLVTTLCRYAAVELFVERARAVVPDFALTEINAWAVAEICRRLDGLPLAIELAAARIELFTAQELLTHLDQRFALLTGGAIDMPTRQQTLRRAIDWSYELLDKGEQMLFRQLGVFVGGCTLDAARVVCAATGGREMEVLDGIAALIDKHLLQRDARDDGRSRFGMLETIREYALERLEERGEAEAMRERHLAYYLALAEAAEPHLRGAQQIVWAERLEEEHDNLRAALTWAHEHGAAEGSSTAGAEAELRLAGALFWFWDLRDYPSEGRRWLEGALTTTNGSASTAARATALFAAGNLATSQSDFVAARARLKESVAIWRELGDTRGFALVLTHVTGLGWVTLKEGRIAEARALFAEGVALWRGLSDRWGLAWALFSLSAAVRRDDPAAARPIAEESIVLFREVGDRIGLVSPLWQLGLIARHQGDHRRAGALVEESLALSRELGSKAMICLALLHLGEVVLEQGEEQRALALFQESLALARPIEYKDIVAECLVGIGGVAGAVRQPERAARLLSAAETLLDTVGLLVGVGPEVRADYDRYVVAARAQLDEASFMVAWAEGQAMSLEQVIAYALENEAAESGLHTAASVQATSTP